MTFIKVNKISYLASLAVACCGPALGTTNGGVAAAEAIPEIIVTGRRLGPSLNEPAYATANLSRADLGLSAGARLDDALRAIPQDRLLAETSAYYLLGVAPDARDLDNRTHTLKVRVAERGATVRSRQFVWLPKRSSKN